MASAPRARLSRRFIAMMLVFIGFVLIGALSMIGLNRFEQAVYIRDIDNIKNKQKLVQQIDTHLIQVFFRSRGYYALKSKDEYDLMFVEKGELEKALAAYNLLSLNEEERKMAVSVEQFKDDFFNNTLPQVVKTIESGGLGAAPSGTFTKSLNDMLKMTGTFSAQSDQKLDQELRDLLHKLSANNYWFVAYILAILVLVTAVTAAAARNIGRPLEALTDMADRIARGDHVEIKTTGRHDEIGLLTNAFDLMVKQVQAKEEELTVQNEELLAQQDELQSQQEELQLALRKMEESELQLYRRNAFIQAMTNTLNKQELLKSIVTNLVLIVGADKGMIVTLNERRDYASFGVSDKGAAQFLEQLEQGVLQRLREEKKPYVITRPAYAHEKGYHIDAGNAYDLYLPVLSADGAVIACIAITRIGAALTEQEMTDADGSAKQVALALEKLSLYEETERQRQLTQDILNTIQEGVQLVTPEGIVLHANSTMSELIAGDASRNMSDEPVEAFFRMVEGTVANSDRLATFMLDCMDERSLRQQFVYEIVDPQRKIVQMYSEPLYRGGERIGTVFVHRDITREYEVDQMKSEFVSTVSHELRTPLSSVLGFAELLLTKELAPERQRKYLNTIHQEAVRLTTLINDFLDVQRMEAGKQTYEMSPVDLVPLISGALDLQRDNAGRHNCALRFAPDEIPFVVNGDADKLKQVFLNLLSNAIKYSPSGGNITIAIRREEKRIVADVTDEGLGIPEDALPKLFTKFYRIDNSDRREIGGTGLGLAIVKEIMKAHGGDVAVRSAFGRGSTFSLHFPLAEPEPTNGRGGVPPAPEQAGGKKTVVLIEDDRSLTELLEQELRGRGFHVLHYAKGQEALKAIKSVVPDAVVVDIMLHHSMDGWTIMKELKQDPQLAHIPIFVSTALDEKETGLTLGAEVYLIKPYPPHVLSQVIHDTLQREDNKKA